MMTLPLFPLNTVLFPGMPLSLHIFEERYKLMIGKCLEARQSFGVVLIQEGIEALGPLAVPHSIGCTAQITQFQPLNQGRLNIVAVGQERFQITSLNHDLPYLVGDVELLPLETGEPQTVIQIGRKLRPWVEHYLQLLTETDNLQIDFQQLPSDPMSLAYLAAFLLQIPPQRKQDLLAALNASALLTDIYAVYRRETTLLRAMLKHQAQEEQDGLFSLN